MCFSSEPKSQQESAGSPLAYSCRASTGKPVLGAQMDTLKDDPEGRRNSFWTKRSHCHTGERKGCQEWSPGDGWAASPGLRFHAVSACYLGKAHVLGKRHDLWVSLETSTQITWIFILNKILSVLIAIISKHNQNRVRDEHVIYTI